MVLMAGGCCEVLYRIEVDVAEGQAWFSVMTGLCDSLVVSAGLMCM